MLAVVQKSIVEHRLLVPGEHVLAAVSGGADSVALLRALHELAPRMNFQLTAAHLHHGIRGLSADEDAAFVRALCARLGVACVQARANVPRRARRTGESIEMAARAMRYGFLARAARRVGADVAATAHTADDQVETVLLKLARGAGPGGLSGIARSTSLQGVRVVRPMLDVSRREVLAFLKKLGQPWREDPSNQDDLHLRNRIRHRVLPLLEAELNPSIRTALLRTAEVLGAEDRWMEEQAQAWMRESRAPDGSLAVEPVAARPLAARRRLLRAWLVSAGVPAATLDFEGMNRLDALLQSRRGTGRTPLAGTWVVRRRYGRLSVERQGAVSPARSEPTTARPATIVAVPGVTDVAGLEVRVLTSVSPGLVKASAPAIGACPAEATLRQSAIGRRRLCVRAWRDGDRMRPLGLNGSRKLQDIFVDAKVPIERRGSVPVFECGREIVWVPGYRVAEGWEVRDPDKPAVHIRIESLANPRFTD